VATKQALVLGVVLVTMALSTEIAAGASTGSTTSAGMRFADQVLAEAPIPAGSRLLSRTPALLEDADASPGIPGLVDLHRIYATAESAYQVFAFVFGHLPKGAEISGRGTSGSPSGSTSYVTISIATSGQHEYFAELVYSVLQTDRGSKVRVDAQSVWEPSRSPTEKIPAAAIAKLIGYGVITVAGGSSDPVSLTLGKRQSAALERALNALPVGPSPMCLENPTLYQIVFRTPAGPAYEVAGDNCEKSVTITVAGKELQPLYDAHCALMKLVAELAPLRAVSTRHDASSKCPPVE
jgi:hypothetical protein